MLLIFGYVYSFSCLQDQAIVQGIANIHYYWRDCDGPAEKPFHWSSSVTPLRERMVNNKKENCLKI